MAEEITPPWLVGLLSGFVGAAVSAIALAFRSGRNIVLQEDFNRLQTAVSQDRHTARSNLDQRHEILLEKLDDIRQQLDDEHDKMRREFGETVRALREKVTQVELFMRDNFVREPAYNAGLSEIKTHLDRLERKIDSKT